MPLSPFPGMDPFLEDSVEWSSFHSKYINSLSDQLADLVAPHFSVRIEQRVYLVTEDEGPNRGIAPDIYLLRNPSETAERLMAVGITVPVLVEPILEPELYERFIEIRDKRSREVITTIELLSPFNKATGSTGRRAFSEKRLAVTHSNTHWIEIDLLRAGERPVEVANKSDYYTLLKRGGTLGPFEVWYFDLRDPMPTIAVPLRGPFADVPLNLQAAFEDAYMRAHYADDIDYSAPVPPPPLRPAVAAWARERILAWQAQQPTDG
jgi:hypothetical protein